MPGFSDNKDVQVEGYNGVGEVTIVTRMNVPCTEPSLTVDEM